MLYYRDNGEPIMGRTLKVPPLKVQKKWYVLLALKCGKGFGEAGSSSFSH